MAEYTQLYQTCDSILRWLAEQSFTKDTHGFQANEIGKEIKQPSTKILYQCIFFMIEEKHVVEATKGNYAISPKGELFISKGGYKKYFEDLEKKEADKIKTDTALIDNATYSKDIAKASKLTMIASWSYVALTLGLFCIGLYICYHSK